MLNIYNPNQQQEGAIKAPVKKENAPKVDFRKYQDVTGDFDNKELVYSMWWIKHKVLIYRITVFVLLGINGLVWIFNFGKWGAYVYGIGEATRLEIVASRFNNYSGIQNHFSPTPLQISTTGLLSGGVNKVDAVAEIINPNKNFKATISYRFIFNTTSTEPREMTLLAGENSIATALGLSEELAAAGGVNFQIEKTSWSRIDNHKIMDPISWQSERLNLEVSDLVFQNSISSESLKANRVAFNLKNASPYSYKTPEFVVGLYNMETLVGVVPLQVGDFKSMEVKPIELRSFAANLDVSEIKVFPQINIYDEASYLPPEK